MATKGWNYTKMAAAAKTISAFLTKKGISNSIKSSRYKTEIKAVEVAYSGTLQELFKKSAMSVAIADLDTTDEKSISGKYKAKVVTLSAATGGLSKGEQFFIVNTYTEKGTVKTKELAPEKFGLTSGGFKTLSAFDAAVVSGIKANTSIPQDVNVALLELYNVVASNTSERTSLPLSSSAKKAMEKIKPQDRQAIGKDFGEVLSMRWYVSQPIGKNFTNAEFSSISNEALVDFVVTKKVGKETIKQNISAKFEAGAAPSIGAIIVNADKVFKTPTGETAAALNVLKSLADTTSNTSTKILAAMETIKHPGYIALKKVIGKSNISIADISANIQKIASASKSSKTRVEMFKAAYKSVYEALGKNASDDSLNVVFSASTYKKYYSLVMAPMGYALVDYMNSQDSYQNVLNKLSRAMNTEQVYLNFAGTNLEFKTKVFSDSKFKFAYGANAKDSDNTGIKFSML